MSKRYLCDLERDELEKVIKVNHKLYDELVDYYYDDEDFWVSEAMSYLTMDGAVLDYSIYYDGNSYITFDKEKPFTSLGNIDNYRHAFGGNDEINETLDKALKVLKIYDDCNNLFGSDTDGFIRGVAFEDEINRYISELSKMIAKYLSSGYDYNDDTIIEALERKYIEDDPNKVYVKDDSYIAYYEESYER
jgi:hypothetical protein